MTKAGQQKENEKKMQPTVSKQASMIALLEEVIKEQQAMRRLMNDMTKTWSSAMTVMGQVEG